MIVHESWYISRGKGFFLSKAEDRIVLSRMHLLVIVSLIAACGDSNDRRWKEEVVGPIKSVSGVWGSGPDDVFLTGGSDDEGEIFHYDGESWAQLELPNQDALLIWSFGFGPDDVWTVGKAGSVLHYDGSTWSVVDSKTDQDLWGVWGSSPNDVFMVGGNVFSGQVTILHWNGTEIAQEELSAEQNPLGVRALFKIYGIGGRVFAVGQSGLIVERTADGWIRHPTGPQGDDDFVAIWGNSADDLVAVGGRSTARISTWDGTAWSTIAPADSYGLNAVFVTAKNEVLVGGLYGSIGVFNRETSEIDYETSNVSIDVHALWADDEGKAYAVGGTFFDPHTGFVISK